MPAPNSSPAEQKIKEALRANNPFERAPVVKAQNIWGDSFPDVPSINAKATDSVFATLTKARQADSILEKIATMVFTAQKGVGKSHLIKRIRRRLQASSEAAFIYASADGYGDLDFVDNLFRRSVAESLEQLGSEGVSQWQEVATLMVAEVLHSRKAGTTVSPAPKLVGKFDAQYHKLRDKGKDLISELVSVIRKLKPNLDPYILKAILWTLSEERGALAVKWLAGEPLDPQDALDLRLPQNTDSELEAKASALTFAAQLISIVGEYKSVVICFDELDTIATDSNGHPTHNVIFHLIKRLFDSLQQSEKASGIVILSVLPEDSWRHVSQAKIASAEKISSYGEPIVLEYLNDETTKALCELILREYYQKKGLVPPSPIYPLEAQAVEAFGSGKPSPREAMKWFAEEINKKIQEEIPSPSPFERLKQAYHGALEQFDSEQLDDSDLIAGAIRFGFEKILDLEKIKHEPLEGVILKGVEEIVPKSKNNGWLHFAVIGEEAGAPVRIGVGVLQHTHGLGVGAGFRRLLDNDTFGFDRGCMVRAKTRKIKRNWDSYEYYQQLIAKGGEWVDLREDEIKPLLALQQVYESCQKFNLTPKKIDSFAFTRNLLQDSPLLKEILSRPEGAIADEALEGEELQRLSDAVDLSTLESALSQEALANEEPLNDADLPSDIQEFAEAVAL